MNGDHDCLQNTKQGPFCRSLSGIRRKHLYRHGLVHHVIREIRLRRRLARDPRLNEAVANRRRIPKRGISKVAAFCHADQVQSGRVLWDQRNREHKCQTSPPKCEITYSTQPRWSPEPPRRRRHCTSPSRFPAPELSPEWSSATSPVPTTLYSPCRKLLTMLYAKLSRNEQDLPRFNNKDLTADTGSLAFTAPSASSSVPGSRPLMRPSPGNGT